MYPSSHFQFCFIPPFVSSFFFFLSNLSTIESPKNVHGPLGNKNWRDAMNEEMHALIKNGTWEMIRAS